MMENNCNETLNFDYMEIPPNPDDDTTVKIISQLCLLMIQFFDIIPSKFNIINNQLADSPETKRPIKTIILKVGYLYWSQISFQFSHEFCHFLIPTEVPENLRWFEESICETSSLFFMRKFSSIWENESILGCPQYSQNLLEYVQLRTNDYESFDLTELFDDSSSISTYFKNEKYDRAKNLFVAINLLPIFEEQPILWKFVPLLSMVKPELSFRESLLAWKSFIPVEFQYCINLIINIFNEVSH